MHTESTLRPGSSITIKLPSGKTVNVEATADTTEIVDEEGRVLYQENIEPKPKSRFEDVARRIVARLRESSSPQSSTWGSKHTDAWDELFNDYFGYEDIVGDVIRVLEESIPVSYLSQLQSLAYKGHRYSVHGDSDTGFYVKIKMQGHPVFPLKGASRPTLEGAAQAALHAAFDAEGDR